MNQKVYDWIAAQIAASAPARNDFRDVKLVTQLADAAATLRGQGSGQVFGMQVAVETIPDADILAERCLAMLEQWVGLLSEEQAEQVATMMNRMDLTPPGGLPTAPGTSPAVARLFVYTKAHLENIETSDEVTDPNVVGAFVGARPTTPIDVVPCLSDVMGGDDHGWWRGGDVTIVRDEEAGALRCELALDLAKVPDSLEIRGVLRTIEDDLFFTGWGLNLEFESDRSAEHEDVMVHVDTVPISHRLERLAAQR